MVFRPVKPALSIGFSFDEPIEELHSNMSIFDEQMHKFGNCLHILEVRTGNFTVQP